MESKEIFKRLYKQYTKKYLNKILASAVLSLILAASTSSVAYLLDPAIKELFINKSETLIYVIPLLIIIAFFVKGISLYSAKLIMIGVAEDVKRDLQNDMFASLIKADTQRIDEKHTGQFIGNLLNDVNLIVNLISTALLNLFKDSLTLIGLLSVMFYQNWKLSIIAIIMIPFASVVARTLGKRIGKVSIEQMHKLGTLSSYLIEIFKNHKIIKIFQKEEYEKNRSKEFIETLKETQRKIAIVFVRASPIMESLTGIMIAIIIFVSAKLIMKNELEVSNFFSFLAAMMLAYQPVRSLATLNLSIQQGLAGARNVLPIIDDVPQVKDESNAKDLNVTNGTIKFENVDFKYKNNENQILNKINLNLPGEKMTALVGQSGAGKSTILNLIPRFYDCKKGEIKIDDQSIKEKRLSSLRKNVSLVSQETTLFDDTILNNIKYANLNATDEEIKEAAKLSFSDEFIEMLPNKYNTIIGENGIRLSGGEKQRLSIARAFLKNSKIILLDEATSSLDSETERKIQDALSFLTKGKTTLVIAHRLSTVLNSHKIYVIDHGEVVAEGNHKELLNNSPAYKNFYDKQIQKD